MMNELQVKSMNYDDWYATMDTTKVFIGGIPVNSLANHYVTVTYKENHVEESETFEDNT